MGYDAGSILRKYDERKTDEWSRLTDAKGELLYRVHLDVLRTCVGPSDRVLEVGAGAGRFTKDLATMGAELVVTDIAPYQIACNRAKMEELGLSGRIRGFHVLDVLDMGLFPDASFDVVVCTGGVVNYLMDRERDGVREMLRVLRSGGWLVLGSMSFLWSALYYMDGVKADKDLLGIEAARWIFETGVQDEEHYPLPSRHWCHMMRASEMDALLAAFPVDVVERRAAGLFSLGRDEALESVRRDPELWDLLVEKELAFSRLATALDCGMNLLYAARKR